jgi:hypothetical protein
VQHLFNLYCKNSLEAAIYLSSALKEEDAFEKIIKEC